MSHFTVLVVGAKDEQAIAEALEPYWELDLPTSEMRTDKRAEFSVEISDEDAEQQYKEFIKSCPTEKQIKYAHERLLKFTPPDMPIGQGRMEPINKKQFEKYCKKHGLDTFCVTQKYGRSKYKTVSQWIKSWHGYSHNKKAGGWGYWHNPDAKWDWYQIGGRWAGYFRLKEQGKGKGKKGEPTLLMDKEKALKILSEPMTCDMAQKKDIDFEGMRLENEADAKETWEKYQQALKEKPEIADSPTPYFEYGVQDGDTKESYIARRTSFSTFAVLKDGEWYERGRMGWWACVSDEKDTDVWETEFQKLIEEASDDTWFAVVDCHI
jgi:hypothetical protein